MMKKLDRRSLFIGFLMSTLMFACLTGGFAETKLGSIKSAKYTDSKVYFNGEEIPMEYALVELVKDGSDETKLYMSVREILEYMNFQVHWQAHDGSINLTMNQTDDHKTWTKKIPSDITKIDADKEAIDLITKTGNWSYVEAYLDYMTEDGISKVVEIYNSKHQNSNEHKKTSDYIK